MSSGRTAATNLSSGGGVRPLEGRIGIVTGGGRGIGMAICENLASKGCSLVINYTSNSSAEPTEKLAAELKSKYNVNTVVVQADLGSENGPEHIVSTARNHLAHPKTGKFVLHVIVNNAGVAKNWPLTEAKAHLENFTHQYNVNVRGPLLLVQAAEPYLPHDRSGRIVNVSSISASLGAVGQSCYGATKAALEAMTRTWSQELAERATVNAINPGPVATDMWWATGPEFHALVKPYMQITPLAKVRKEVDLEAFVEQEPTAGGRPAYVGEVAGTVGMLCTDDAAWTTGSVICSNGGMKFSY